MTLNPLKKNPTLVQIGLSQSAWVNVAFRFQIGQMNQLLKAVSIIKNIPEGAVMAGGYVAVSFRLLRLMGVTS